MLVGEALLFPWPKIIHTNQPNHCEATIELGLTQKGTLTLTVHDETASCTIAMLGNGHNLAAYSQLDGGAEKSTCTQPK